MEASVPPKRTAFQGPCYFKLLVNNLAAGSIIGKNGAVIASIEQQTGCALRLSHAGIYYPGTEDRILIISGSQEALNSALCVILGKIHDTQAQYGNEMQRKDPYDTTNQIAPPVGSVKISCKIMVPKSAVAAIIGKGGQQIRDLQETTGALIQVSSREEALVERSVTVSGSLDQVQAAALALASCIQSDLHLRDHMTVSYKPPVGLGLHPGGAFGGAIAFGQTFGPAAAYSAHQGQEILSQHCDISIQVSEQVVGAVIGKGGKCVSEIMKQTGARVQVSQKGDFIPGTTDRKIIISGPVAAVHSAHVLLLQKIQSAHDRAAPGTPVHTNGLNHSVMSQSGGGPSGLLVPSNMQFMHGGGLGY